MRFGSLFRNAGETHDFRRLTPERFREAMDRERARSDRWGQPLALLSLGVADLRTGRRTLRQIARILARRMRLTDEAGWIDRRHIRHPHAEHGRLGRWTLADEICLEFPEAVPLPQCRVYCYPSDWFLQPVSGKAMGPMHPLRRHDRGHGAVVLSRVPRWKRAVDIIGASLFLVVHALAVGAWPALGPADVAGARPFSPDPRGLGGRHFTLYKFRTMVGANAELLKEQLRDRNEQEGRSSKFETTRELPPSGDFCGSSASTSSRRCGMCSKATCRSSVRRRRCPGSRRSTRSGSAAASMSRPG